MFSLSSSLIPINLSMMKSPINPPSPSIYLRVSIKHQTVPKLFKILGGWHQVRAHLLYEQGVLMSINTIRPHLYNYEEENYKNWPPTRVTETGISVFRRQRESLSSHWRSTLWCHARCGRWLYAWKRFMTWTGFIGYYFIYYY